MKGSAYQFKFHKDPEVTDGPQGELEQFESLRALQASIALLTGGCEICVNARGLYCLKHRHPVKPGDPRCADFSRRFPEDPRAASKAEAERLVRDRLGLSAKVAKRVIGAA